jgi:putative transposase
MRTQLEQISFQAVFSRMPSTLKRYQHSGQTHFITFCCFRRRNLFLSDASKEIFELALERVRSSFQLCVYGYVIMPEHVHLLLSEPERETLAVAIQSLKQGVSRRLIGEAEHFWQKRYYDGNIRNRREFTEKLRYIHRNPVSKGLCVSPEDWRWSSFLHYATGAEGCVEIESEWTANKRERAAGRLAPLAAVPPQAKSRLEWDQKQWPWPIQAAFGLNGTRSNGRGPFKPSVGLSGAGTIRGNGVTP